MYYSSGLMLNYASSASANLKFNTVLRRTPKPMPIKECLGCGHPKRLDRKCIYCQRKVSMKNINTIYIIGNGTRNKQQIDFLKDKTTFSVNKASLEFDSWNYYPTYYGSFEQQIHIKKWMTNYWLRHIIKPKYDNIIKFFPIFAKNYMNYLPNTTLLHSITWEDYFFKKLNTKGFLRLGSSGAIATYIAITILKYRKVVLIGMDASYKAKQKDSDRQLRAWKRLHSITKNIPQVSITNSSIINNLNQFYKHKELK